MHVQVQDHWSPSGSGCAGARGSGCLGNSPQARRLRQQNLSLVEAHWTITMDRYYLAFYSTGKEIETKLLSSLARDLGPVSVC